MFILLILYRLVIFVLYLPLMLLCYIPAVLSGNGFRYFQRFGFGLPVSESDAPSIWFHAASVGEVNSLAYLANVLRGKYKGYRIIVSVMTRGGYETALKALEPEAVFLLPVENGFIYRKIIREFNVKLAAVTDTELWPVFITAVSRKVPLMLLNGRISNQTFNIYKRLRWFFAPLLKRYRFIAAKSEIDAERFRTIARNDKNICVGYNIKYIFDRSRPVKKVEDILKGNIVVAASTHEPEERMFIKAVGGAAFHKIIIIPRHINRSDDICREIAALGFEVGKFSSRKYSPKVLVIDSLGLVETFYQLADKIFVGGSIAPVGGHNIFEAFKYKKRVAIGPNMQNFTDIAELGYEYGLADLVRNTEELAEWAGKPEPEVDFAPFFTELDRLQKERLTVVLECIDQCIISTKR